MVKHPHDSAETAKATARSQLRAARRSLTPEQIATRGQALARILPTVVPAGSAVAGYVPMPGEPDVRAFLSHHGSDGSPVYVPVIADPRDRRLEWVSWSPEAELRRSSFAAIDEPAGARLSTAALRARHPEGLTILVPGLAVDHDGARMGQGGGFYDTAFGSMPPESLESTEHTEHTEHTDENGPAEAPGALGALRFIAVVHAAEVLRPGSFPVESHDLRVHAIVTEREATTLRAL